jgi:formylglycine-generating enzyme required for sulfatase activity
MQTLNYTWRGDDGEHELRFAPVAGTAGKPYLFGAEPNRRPIEIRDFHMSTTPVTQALWTRVMGSNPETRAHLRRPVDKVSWDHITGDGGFLQRINSSEILTAVGGSERGWRFRLPSETEWEYAARGGPHWTDGFAFSGSNDIDAVAWYGLRWSGGHLKWAFVKHRLRLRRWLLGTGFKKPSRTHDVATKAPNQLGLYDMSGNVWEWCEDMCVDDIDAVPRDGTPWLGPGTERRLRGGCHHNWDIHCTVWWRYGIVPDAHDGCIGFRLVLAPA